MCICLCSVSYCNIQILLQSVLGMFLQFLCFWLPLAYRQHIVTRGNLILVVSSGFVGLGLDPDVREYISRIIMKHTMLYMIIMIVRTHHWFCCDCIRGKTLIFCTKSLKNGGKCCLKTFKTLIFSSNESLQKLHVGSSARDQSIKCTRYQTITGMAQCKGRSRLRRVGGYVDPRGPYI